MSLAFLLPDDASAKRTVDVERGGASPRRGEDASAAPYFRKLPAIQWYWPDPVRFSTCSPKLRRFGFGPPSPGEPTKNSANRGSEALVNKAALPERDTPLIPPRLGSAAGHGFTASRVPA